MSRFLFVVPPLAGHINPTIAVGTELLSRGHQVAWAGHASWLTNILPDGGLLFSTDGILSTAALDVIALRAQGLRGAEAFQFLWKELILPLAEAMLPELEAAVDSFLPDVVIVDQQAIAGALVARRRGLRWATSATTSSELVDSLAAFPLFTVWLQAEMHAFQRRAGIAPSIAAQGDLRFSDHLVLAFSARDLVGEGPFPSEWVFVGPAIGSRQSAQPMTFPWSWLDPQRKHVLLTLGTVSAHGGIRFFELAIAAAARLENQLQMIVVAPADMFRALPSNVLVVAKIPQLQLLEHVDLVLCHAGHNTVCETLARGVPLLVAPIRDDQPIIAQQVVDSGTGLRLKYGRVTEDQIVEALLAGLHTPSLRAAAQRVQAAFREAGGAIAAANHLELLAEREPKS